jgi:hypothetical protein
MIKEDVKKIIKSIREFKDLSGFIIDELLEKIVSAGKIIVSILFLSIFLFILIKIIKFFWYL